MNYLLPVTILLVASGCASVTQIQYEIRLQPPHPLVPAPDGLVITNSYEIPPNYRDNKEEQFNSLVNKTLYMVRDGMNQFMPDSQVRVREGLAIVSGRRDSSVNALMNQEGVDHVIFIRYFDVHFQQTEVVVTETDDGKHREAFYDIVSGIGYTMQDTGGIVLDTLITVSRFHSSRSVLSGLLAAGPNIVLNNVDAMEIVRVNVDQYLNCFFPRREFRQRFVYIGKELKPVGDAIGMGNYDDAFTASWRLTDAKDPKVAAKAFFNCAVLSERKGDYESVVFYLEESLRRQVSPQARAMRDEY